MMANKAYQQYGIVLSITLCVAVFGFSGCASTGKAHQVLDVEGGNLLNTHQDESLADAVSALKAVTGAVSDKQMTEEELYEAAKRMQTDPEAKEAVEAITSSFHQQSAPMKYSPATGKRYSGNMEIDPETGVELLPLE